MASRHFAISTFTGCRGHPCPMKCETHGGFHKIKFPVPLRLFSELDRCRSGHEALGLLVLHPDVDLGCVVRGIFIGDEPVNRDRVIGLHRHAIGRTHLLQPRVARADPIRHQFRQKAQAHIARQDHPGQTFFLRRFVVGEPTRDIAHTHRPGVRATLILADEQLERAERVPDIDLFETFHVRFMKRWSIWASTSSFWFFSVDRITTNTIVPVRPVFSKISFTCEVSVTLSPGLIGATNSTSLPASKPRRPKRGTFSKKCRPLRNVTANDGGATIPPYGPFFAASSSVKIGLVSPSVAQYRLILSALTSTGSVTSKTLLISAGS